MRQRIPDELKFLYREGRLLPFVGAGISMSVEWNDKGKVKRGPSWRELVEQAALQLGFKEPQLLSRRGDALQILEYYKLKKGSLAPLTNWLHCELLPSDEDLRASSTHRCLAKMTENCRVFYTTNYDNFLERSLRLANIDVNVIVREADMGKSSGAIEVVKFHGDFGFPEGIVATESDYNRRLSFTTPMDLRLRSDMLGRAVLFMGYSFKDSNVAYLFHLVKEQLNRLPGSITGHRAYIVAFDPSDFELSLFHQRNIQVIPISSTDGTRAVADLLEELVEP
jgi:hypothetical protein